MKMKYIELNELKKLKNKNQRQQALSGMGAPCGYGYPFTINVPKSCSGEIRTPKHSAKRNYSQKLRKKLKKDWRRITISDYTRKPYSRRPFTYRHQEESAGDRKQNRQDLIDQALSDWETGHFYDTYDNYYSAFEAWLDDHKRDLIKAHPNMSPERISQKYMDELELRTPMTQEATERQEEIVDKMWDKMVKEAEYEVENNPMITAYPLEKSKGIVDDVRYETELELEEAPF